MSTGADTPGANVGTGPDEDRSSAAAVEQWYAVVDANGNLVSLGTVVADQGTLTAKGLTSVALASPPDLGNSLWDVPSRSFVPIQTIDRVADFIANHQAFWNALPAAQQTALQTALQNLLGSMRYRRQTDSVNIT